jgi:hypothetical protein
VPWGRSGTYGEVASRLPDNAQIVFDDDGRLRFAALEPEPEPASLLDLRAAVNAMLPCADPPEVLLEVFSALYMLILLNQLMESRYGLSHADRRDFALLFADPWFLVKHGEGDPARPALPLVAAPGHSRRRAARARHRPARDRVGHRHLHDGGPGDVRHAVGAR